MISVVEILRGIVSVTSDLYSGVDTDALFNNGYLIQHHYLLENSYLLLPQKEKDPKRKVHFYADNFVAINQELSLRGKTIAGAKKKTPAILLFCDNLPVRRELFKDYEIEATLHIIIADDAVPDGNGDVQREKVFHPILYPIYDCFMEAIRTSPRIFTKEGALQPETQDRYRLGGKMSMFGDFLNGIEIKNLKLKIKEESCL